MENSMSTRSVADQQAGDLERWASIFWRNLENLPQFMSHLQSVQVTDDRHSHWVASAPLGQNIEWDAEIVNDEPNHLIAWTSINDAPIENSGFVRFQSAPGDRGTEVKVVMEYQPPGGYWPPRSQSSSTKNPNGKLAMNSTGSSNSWKPVKSPPSTGSPKGVKPDFSSGRQCPPYKTV